MTNFVKFDADPTQKREIDLGVLLSVTTGKIIVPLLQMCDAVGYVTGDPALSDIGAAIAGPRAREIVLQQHPQLRDVKFPNIDEVPAEKREKFCKDWIVAQKMFFKCETLPVSPTNVPVTVSFEDQKDWLQARNPNLGCIEAQVPARKPPSPKLPGNSHS